MKGVFERRRPPGAAEVGWTSVRERNLPVAGLKYRARRVVESEVWVVLFAAIDASADIRPTDS
jgi:hypothetical protein